MKVTGGIDLGKTATREIFLESRWKTVHVTGGARQATIVGAVPSQALTFRRFSLPFTDRKKIREIVKEELTDTLAFPLEEAEWDFSNGAAGELFVTIARKDMIKETVNSSPRPIELLDAEPYGLVRTALYCAIKDALIIDFGASKTVLCGLVEGNLDSIKVMANGSDMLTRLISGSRKLSLHDAETLKIEKGMALAEVKDAIIKLFRTANLPSPFPYPQIVITGGGAQLKGLKEFLEENLKTPVSSFTLPEKLSPFTDVVAFGMALKGNKEYSAGVNLVEGKRQGANPFTYWIIAVLAPLVIFSAGIKIRESTMEMTVKKFKQETVKVFQKEFPDVKNVVSPLTQFQTKLAEKKALAEGKGSDTLAVMDHIARVVAEKDIKVFEIDMSDNAITLSGETASYQEVEYLRKRLLESFKTVELREGKTLPSRRITFTVIISLKDAQDHAGKP